MSLPRLDVPTYDLILPSTGKTVKYRPFLVREHKILLMLKDSSKDEIIKIIEEIIDNCTYQTLPVKDLPSFDLEYIFCKLREKSIGEITELSVNCACGNSIPYNMDLRTLEVARYPDHDSKIMLTDKIGIQMKYPKFKDTLSVFLTGETEKILDLIIDSIAAIYTTDGSYQEIDDDNKAELIEFANTMTKNQFEKLENFFLTMPKLTHDIEVTCDQCNAVTKTTLEGLQNFFA